MILEKLLREKASEGFSEQQQKLFKFREMAGMLLSEELYQLIRSMSKAEKRHFKLTAQQNSKNGASNYIKLFDAIDKAKNYDEQKILQRVGRDRIAANLSSTKYQLSKLLCRVIYDFNGRARSENNITEEIGIIKLLFDRGLYGMAGKHLTRAKQIAQEHHNNLHLLELLSLQQQMALQGEVRTSDESLTVLIRERQSILDSIVNESSYAELYYRLRELSQSKKSIDKSAVAVELQEIMAAPLVQEVENAQSLKARQMYYRIHGHSAIMRIDWVQAYAMFEKLLKLWEAHPILIADDLRWYMADLTNFFTACCRAEKFEDLEPILNKVKDLPSLSFADKVQTFQNAAYMELHYYLQNGLLARGLPAVNQIKANLEIYQNKLSIRWLLLLFHNLSTFFFLSSLFEESLDYFKKIQKFANDKNHPDLRTLADLFELIIHFQLDNIEVVSNRLRAFTRALRKRRKMNDFYLCVIRHLQKLIRLNKGKMRLPAFKSFLAELKQLQSSKGKGVIKGFTELEFWLISRISNRSISDVVREKIDERDRSRKTETSEEAIPAVIPPSASPAEVQARRRSNG